MTGRLILDQRAINADREFWLRCRLPLITGSEVAALLGISGFSSAFRLYHAKIGNLPVDEADDKPALARGRHLEPVIADMFTAQTGMQTRQAGLFTSPVHPWMGATLDGFALDPEGCSHDTWSLFDRSSLPVLLSDRYAPEAMTPVEWKSWATPEGWGEPPHGKMPGTVRAQAIWNMAVYGSQEIRVGVLFVLPWRLAIYRLSMDDPAVASDLRFMQREALLFRERVDARDEPPVDAHPETTKTLRELHPDLEDREVVIPVSLASRYVAASQAEQRAKARRRQIGNELRYRMGSAARAVARDPATGKLVKVVSRSIGDTHVEAFDRHDDKLNPGRWGK